MKIKFTDPVIKGLKATGTAYTRGDSEQRRRPEAAPPQPSADPGRKSAPCGPSSINPRRSASPPIAPPPCG